MKIDTSRDQRLSSHLRYLYDTIPENADWNELTWLADQLKEWADEIDRLYNEIEKLRDQLMHFHDGREDCPMCWMEDRIERLKQQVRILCKNLPKTTLRRLVHQGVIKND